MIHFCRQIVGCRIRLIFVGCFFLGVFSTGGILAQRAYYTPGYGRPPLLNQEEEEIMFQLEPSGMEFSWRTTSPNLHMMDQLSQCGWETALDRASARI